MLTVKILPTLYNCKKKNLICLIDYMTDMVTDIIDKYVCDYELETATTNTSIVCASYISGKALRGCYITQ